MAQPNLLALDFPELAELNESISDKKSAWNDAEGFLRKWRNKDSHLQRLPESELREMSDQFLDKFFVLLKTASFISAFPMVQVMDYRQEPLTSERKATFQLLQGISPVFQRIERIVPCELPRGAVGFLSRQGVFVSAVPWLALDDCPYCKRPEVFVFNRFEDNKATYIAMQSGHPHEGIQLSSRIAAEIQAAPSK